MSLPVKKNRSNNKQPYVFVVNRLHFWKSSTFIFNFYMHKFSVFTINNIFLLLLKDFIDKKDFK
ncbi:hypothetical protein BIZ35_01760 [Heyndrickxia coagulans]|nr:hypothetical protein BIZ35_01760 [Heyndrickxia coagulans]KYC63176.1 hypothetical protein B4100_0336 [Heyndrickxia coagulans]